MPHSRHSFVSCGPDAATQPEAALVFAALGDATRLHIVSRLCVHGPQSIAALAAETSVTRQAVTKHLRVLGRARLVHGMRCGRSRLWALRPGRLAEVRRYLEQISVQWDDTLERLRVLVETSDEY